MPADRQDSSLALRSAEAVRRAFEAYWHAFTLITLRAKPRFENRDWHGLQRDANERLALYPQAVTHAARGVRQILGTRADDKGLWARMRAAYAADILGMPNAELAETFFNSVTRRTFTTVGVDTHIEFVDWTQPPRGDDPAETLYRVFRREADTASVVRDILRAYPFQTRYENIKLDAHLAGDEIDAQWRAEHGDRPIDEIQILAPVFFRDQRAYLVGRVRGGGAHMPLVLALVNTSMGLILDAALTTEDEVSIVFSFTRAYFHVGVDDPSGVIRFLASIMPSKPVAELYTAVGCNKHGKTELYRALLRHLHQSHDRFEIAPGDAGLVMVVFTLPSYDVVFKVIRDRIPPPKTVARGDVMRKYELVFQHDRAGRLIDAAEFENLVLARDRFREDLLDELTSSAGLSVIVKGDRVDIRHVYTERRVTPLNLYLRRADETAAADAAVDYGQAIKDLAATNIFPGDLLLKNFGVTRHGRVVFYDYDELTLLNDCAFRDFPESPHDEDELRAEPWFHVGENDIFPQEFVRFLGLSGVARARFLDRHADLFDAEFWRGMQARHRAGEVVDIRPYRRRRRLRLKPGVPAGAGG